MSISLTQIVRKDDIAIVLPMKDLARLSPDDRHMVEIIRTKIDTTRFNTGQKPLSQNSYIVVNRDDLHARAIQELVLIGEKVKAGMEVSKNLAYILETGDFGSLLEIGTNVDATEDLKEATIDILIENHPGYGLRNDMTIEEAMGIIEEIDRWKAETVPNAVLREVQHVLDGMTHKKEIVKWKKKRGSLDDLKLNDEWSIAVMRAAILYHMGQSQNAKPGD